MQRCPAVPTAPNNMAGISQKTIEIDKPDGTKKILNIGTENQNLVVEQGKITVYADVVFTPQDNN